MGQSVTFTEEGYGYVAFMIFIFQNQGETHYFEMCSAADLLCDKIHAHKKTKIYNPDTNYFWDH